MALLYAQSTRLRKIAANAFLTQGNARCNSVATG